MGVLNKTYLNKVLNHLLVIVTSFFSVSCIQTRTLTTSDQTLNEFCNADYIGTFSVIYYIDRNKNINIEPLQTLESIYKNDSIIRKRVKLITFAHQKFDTIVSKKMNEEMVSILNYVKKEGKIKNYRVSSIFDEIGSHTKSNYNIYFISTGFTKDTILAKKEKNLKTLNTSLLVLSGFAFGITGSFIYTNMTKNTFTLNYPIRANYLHYKDAFEGKQGLRGFVIVYDKTKKEICYIREQFFSSSKNPLELNAIKKQIKNAFKELYF